MCSWSSANPSLGSVSSSAYGRVQSVGEIAAIVGVGAFVSVGDGLSIGSEASAVVLVAGVVVTEAGSGGLVCRGSQSAAVEAWVAVWGFGCGRVCGILWFLVRGAEVSLQIGVSILFSVSGAVDSGGFVCGGVVSAVGGKSRLGWVAGCVVLDGVAVNVISGGLVYAGGPSVEMWVCVGS